MEIEVINRQRLVRIDGDEIGNLARRVLSQIGKRDAAVTVVFVRDRIIRDLNRQFRRVDRATDVLSFSCEDESNSMTNGFREKDFLGDIVISTDTATRQASESGLSMERELKELVIHGVLHLCGYDHQTDNGEMNRLELKLRRKLLD